MENVNKPIAVDPEKLKKMAEAAQNTQKMLLDWAQRQGSALLKKMELERHKHTLNLHWPKIRQGWLGGFVSGVQSGFQLGYQTSSKLSEQFLENSTLAITGTEVEVIESRNEQMRTFFTETLALPADLAVEALMAKFATPVPKKPEAVAAEEAGQERLPGL